jgi:hypothetical protein
MGFTHVWVNQGTFSKSKLLHSLSIKLEDRYILPDLLKIITFVFCMFTLRFHLSQNNLRLSNNVCKPFADYTVNREALLFKLDRYNIRGHFLNIIEDMYNEKREYVLSVIQEKLLA